MGGFTSGEKNVIVEASIPQLGLTTADSIDKLSTESKSTDNPDFDDTAKIDLPPISLNGVKPGIYDLKVRVAYNRGKTITEESYKLTVTGEEKGLWGSQYYSEHPIFPLDKTTVDLNTDMIGRVDTERKTADTLNYIYVIGHDKLSSDLAKINEGVNAKHLNMTLDYKYDDPKDVNRFYYRSDHYNFAAKGVPIIFYFNGTHRDYHRPTDTVDKINFDLMEKRVRLIYHTAWVIANKDTMLKRDIPLNMPAR